MDNRIQPPCMCGQMMVDGVCIGLIGIPVKTQRHIAALAAPRALEGPPDPLDRAWAIIEKLSANVSYIVVRQNGIERRIDETELYELVCAIQDARLARGAAPAPPREPDARVRAVVNWARDIETLLTAIFSQADDERDEAEEKVLYDGLTDARTQLAAAVRALSGAPNNG